MESSQGHGYPGGAVRRVTVPCRATHTAVESATMSALPDFAAPTHSSIPRTEQRERLRAELQHRAAVRPSWTGARSFVRWPDVAGEQDAVPGGDRRARS